MSTDKKAYTLSPNESPQEFVIRRMSEAAITLYRLPEKSYRQGFSRYWPQTVNKPVAVKGWPVPVLADNRDTNTNEADGRGVYRQDRVYAQDALPSYFSPKPREIDEMDECLPWLSLLENDTTRRIVAMRSVVHRISLKPLFSWKRISESVGCNERAAKLWFEKGIKSIAKKLTFKPSDNTRKLSYA